MDSLCIYISSEDSSSHIIIYSDCNDFINISATSDEFITIDSTLTNGIIISSTDCSEHIQINSDFTLGFTIYSSYVCTIDQNGYLEIEPDTVYITPAIPYGIIDVFSNIDWEIVEFEE